MTSTPNEFPAPLRPSSARHTAAICAVLLLGVLLAYANSLRAPFLFDDQDSIVENPSIRHLGWRMFTPPGGAGITVEGRPLLNASFALNYAVGGLDVRSYHVVNLGIHALATLTFFGLARRTLRRVPGAAAEHATEIALAAALLWALHPLQTESVTYLVQRTESLMGLFYLLTLYGFVRGCDSPPGRGWFVIAVAACTLGMATKEVMVSAPLLVLLYDRTFVAGSFREAWRRRRNVYLALAASWLLLGYLLLGSGSRGGTIGASAGVTWWQYALCQSRALVHYLGLALWPDPLVFDYGSDFVTFGQAAPYIVVDLVLVGLTGFALWRRPALGFLGVWFFFILAPTTSVVGGTRQMLAEHRMYLSLGAVTVLVALGCRRWLGRGSWLAWSGLAVALASLTAARNADYRSALSIYTDTVAKRPGNAYAHNNLGHVLLQAGRTTEAIAQFTLALQHSPNRLIAHNNLAGALANAGRFEEAMAHAQAAVKLNPNYAEAHYNLATGLLRAGNLPAALAEYENAVRLRPDYAEAHCNYGLALVRAGRPEDGIREYEKAVHLRPDYAEAYFNLAVAHQQQGRLGAALEHYETVLRLQPDRADAHNNMGLIFTVQRRLPEAMEHYRAALRLRPDHAEAHANLGAMLVETGRFPEAIMELEAALRLDPNNTLADFHLGNALCATGRPALAIPHYEAALRGSPDSAEYHNNLANALFEGANRVDDAIAHYHAALRLDPNSAEAHCNLGTALNVQGNRAEAIQHLQEALRLRPDYAFAREQLAAVQAGRKP